MILFLLVFGGIYLLMEWLLYKDIGYGVLWPKELKPDASDTEDI